MSKPIDFFSVCRRYMKLSACMLSALAFLSSGISHAGKRPNVIIMMTDDQGYGDVGAHGNPHLRTPNIEQIGKEGLEMHTFVTYPNCSATRAALLTGRYPYRVGVTAVVNFDHYMNESETTLAEVLRDEGYRTGIFGKWHLGDSYPMRPSNQGFDEVLVHRAGGIGAPGNDWAGPPGNSYFDPILQHNDEQKQFKGYVDDVFTDAALSFIDEHKASEEPFFLYLASNLPHWPLQVPDHRAQRFRDMGLHEDNALVFGMIENIDDNVGRVLEKVKEAGIEEDTIVIFMSDNGPRHRRTKNDPFPGRWVANMRGTKTSVYEAGVRVPFYIRWPGKLPAGAETNLEMGTALDIFPTILDMVDVELPKNIEIDGRSLYPLWSKNDASNLKDRLFFTQLHYGDTPFQYMHFAVRGERYKLVGPHDSPHSVRSMPTDEEIEHVLNRLELFDLHADPSERINIASKHPEIVDQYLEAYEDWFIEVNEERAAKGIQRIHLGTDEAPNAYLSRYDWGGPRVRSRNELGHWRVKTEAATYRIQYDLPSISKNGVAHLKYKDVHLKKKIKKGQKKVVFNNVTLPAGEGDLHAYMRVERLPEGPLFVHIDRK